MSDLARGGLVLGLAVASIASYPISLVAPCRHQIAVAAVGLVLGICAFFLARPIDPDYSDAPRLARLARALGPLAGKLALAVVLLSPVWGFAVSEWAWSRRYQDFSRALKDVRALAKAQQSFRKTAGTYVTLECLAGASRCPTGVRGPAMTFLSEPVRGGYRFAYRGVSLPESGGRLAAFVYAAVPTVNESDCLQVAGDTLVCTDSTDLLCRMPAASVTDPVPASGKCPAGCVEIREPRP